MGVAERVRQAAHEFGPEPVEDDLAVLVLQAPAADARTRHVPKPPPRALDVRGSGPSGRDRCKSGRGSPSIDMCTDHTGRALIFHRTVP